MERESKFYRMVDWSSIELDLGVSKWGLSDKQYRTLFEAQYLINNRDLSLRQLEGEVSTGVGHRTIWRDLHWVLPTLSIVLYDECMAILRSHRDWMYCYRRKMEEKAKKRW